MKSKKALWNVIINTMAQIVNVVLSFAARKVFLVTLGMDMLGLNSVFSSILGFLSLTELGLGVSVSVCLFKPLAENNKKAVASYMNYLRKMYYLVGGFILIAGISLLPFLSYIVNGNYEINYVRKAFVLYLLSTVVSYFFSHKKVLLNADQKSYIVTASQMIYKIVVNGLQITSLLLFKNYYLFLAINIVCSFTECYVVSVLCNKQYPYLKHSKESIDLQEKENLISKVKGMVCYKVGNYLIEGTDNIILSTFLGTVVVAYYSNYYLIINMLFAIFAGVATSSVAGLGNILYSDKEYFTMAFRKLQLLQHLVFSFSATALFVLSTDFVDLFFGKESVLPTEVILIMVAVYYIKGYSQGLEALRTSLGRYEKDKYINLAIAVLNVVISVGLVKSLGVAGVLLGTLICYCIKELVVLPFYVMKDVEQEFAKRYLLEMGEHLLVTLSIMIIMYGIHMKLFLINEYVTWVMNGLICFAITMGVNVGLYRKSAEYLQLKDMVLTMLKKR